MSNDDIQLDDRENEGSKVNENQKEIADLRKKIALLEAEIQTSSRPEHRLEKPSNQPLEQPPETMDIISDDDQAPIVDVLPDEQLEITDDQSPRIAPQKNKNKVAYSNLEHIDVIQKNKNNHTQSSFILDTPVSYTTGKSVENMIPVFDGIQNKNIQEWIKKCRRAQ
jgi:hypothetical protein